MPRFKDYDQTQGSFAILVPEKLLDQDHPARVINKIVDILILEDIYSYYTDVGNEAYHPKMMLKVLFYSYYKGVFSSRKMEDNLINRADYIYLSGNQVPDFRTLNNFRTRHLEVLPALFAQIVMLCFKLGLVDFNNLAVDGQKIQSNATYRKHYTKKRAQERIEKLEKHMSILLKKDITVDFSEELRSKKVLMIEKEMNRLKELVTEIEELQKEKSSEKEKQSVSKNIVDKEAKLMKHKDGITEPSYNHQSIVDSAYGITVAVQTKNELDCPDDLFTLVEEAKETIDEIPIKNVLADCGFNDYAAMVKMEDDCPENYYVPDRLHESDKNQSRKSGKYSKNNFRKNDDGTYSCPNNKILYFKSYKEKCDDYTTSQYECKDCGSCADKSKCTKSKNRTLYVDSREVYRENMRAKLKSEEGRKIYEKRQGLVESTHGHDQKNLGFTQHFLRGLKKASLEFTLIRIGSNLGKIIRFRAFDMLSMA